jgi:hypothetical protein
MKKPYISPKLTAAAVTAAVAASALMGAVRK